jgi:hypothetical protein
MLPDALDNAGGDLMERSHTESSPVSAEVARMVLTRAAELDHHGESISSQQLRTIAREAGISDAALDAALLEVRDRGLITRGKPEGAVRAPLWVRICLFAVPDRTAASIYYWLFVAGLIALPVVAVESPKLDAAPAFAGMLACVFALWSTSRAIRWFDVHGWPPIGASQTPGAGERP